MKLVNLLSDYFVVKDGDTIVASTESTDNVQELSLLEVKQLIGKPTTREMFLEDVRTREIHPLEKLGVTKGFILGWGLCEGENEDKKYTQEDIEEAIRYGINLCFENKDLISNNEEAATKQLIEKYIQKLQPQDVWDVDFVDGKLRLI